MPSQSTGLPVLPPAAPGGVAAAGKEALVKDMRRGAVWTGASTMLLRVSNIALMAVVARIVAPDELGVFALAITVQAILVSVAELGVASAIARTDLDIEKIAPTVVTIAVATSLALGSLMAVFAGPLADFLGAPQAEGPIRILAISVALIGPVAVPGAQLQRTFRQDVLFRANVIAFVPASGVLLLLAIDGDGASAFAWSRVAGQLVAGTLMFVSVGRKYLPGFNKAYFRPLMKFGIPLALANILSQVLLNVDYVFVGRAMTESDVGLYMLAFNVSMWSGAVIGAMLNGIVLPAFSAVLRDKGDPSTAVVAAVRIVAWIAAPIAAFTFTFSTPLITTIYGQKWSDAGPVLGVLSFYGVVAIFGLLFANIIIATGRTGVLFGVQIAALVVLVPALSFGISHGGLIGVAVAHIVVVSGVTLPVYLMAVKKTTGTTVRGILRAMVGPACAAVAAAGAAWALTLPLDIPWAKLLVGGIVGALVYGLLTRAQLQTVVPGFRMRRRAGGRRAEA